MGGEWFNTFGNPAGSPPPMGDPDTVLKNYMAANNCSEAEAKAALEKMYGKPQMQMPGMNANGSIDMTFNPSGMQMSSGMPMNFGMTMMSMLQNMPLFGARIPGFTANGAIDFTYRPVYSENSLSGAVTKKAEPGTVAYYEALGKATNMSRAEKKQIKAEMQPYFHDIVTWRKEYKAQWDAEYNAIKRDNYSSRKEYRAARKALKKAYDANEEAYVKQKLQEKYPDKDIGAIMYNAQRMSRYAGNYVWIKTVQPAKTQESQVPAQEAVVTNAEPEAVEIQPEIVTQETAPQTEQPVMPQQPQKPEAPAEPSQERPPENEEANLDSTVLAQVNELKSGGKSPEDIAMYLHEQGVSDDLIPAYFKSAGLELPERGPERPKK